MLLIRIQETSHYADPYGSGSESLLRRDKEDKGGQLPKTEWAIIAVHG